MENHRKENDVVDCAFVEAEDKRPAAGFVAAGVEERVGWAARGTGGIEFFHDHGADPYVVWRYATCMGGQDMQARGSEQLRSERGQIIGERADEKRQTRGNKKSWKWKRKRGGEKAKGKLERKEGKASAERDKIRTWFNHLFPSKATTFIYTILGRYIAVTRWPSATDAACIRYVFVVGYAG